MPTTDFHDASSSSSLFAFSNLIKRRDKTPLSHAATTQEIELEAFLRNVAVCFHDLSAVNPDDFLSIPWLQKLLDAFLCCQEEFRAILFNNRAIINKSPMEKPIYDYFERSVKALDVCNAICDGIEQIKQWQKQLEIVLCALDNQRCIGEGQIRRAKKALVDLALGMIDEKGANPSFTHRNRSFGRSNIQRENKNLRHFRSNSWSVSRSWSAAKQLQLISSNLIPPKANEIGLNLAVFTMSYVLLFVMWALVAAIPCQDRGLLAHFNGLRPFLWAGPILSLHERILEESKKRERRNACGLLKEIHDIEKCARSLSELADCVQFPVTEEKEREVRERIEEVRAVYGGVKEELEPLARRVREVFHCIVRSRTEGLDSVGRRNNLG